MSHSRNECDLCDMNIKAPIIPNGAGITFDTNATQTDDGEWHFMIDQSSIRVLSREQAKMGRGEIHNGIRDAFAEFFREYDDDEPLSDVAISLLKPLIAEANKQIAELHKQMNHTNRWKIDS